MAVTGDLRPTLLTVQGKAVQGSGGFLPEVGMGSPPTPNFWLQPELLSETVSRESVWEVDS